MSKKKLALMVLAGALLFALALFFNYKADRVSLDHDLSLLRNRDWFWKYNIIQKLTFDGCTDQSFIKELKKISNDGENSLLRATAHGAIFRIGDKDPAHLIYIKKQFSESPDEVDDILPMTMLGRDAVPILAEFLSDEPMKNKTMSTINSMNCYALPLQGQVVEMLKVEKSDAFISNARAFLYVIKYNQPEQLAAIKAAYLATHDHRYLMALAIHGRNVSELVPFFEQFIFLDNREIALEAVRLMGFIASKDQLDRVNSIIARIQDPEVKHELGELLPNIAANKRNEINCDPKSAQGKQ